MRRRERLFKKRVKRNMRQLQRAQRRSMPSNRWRTTWLEKNADGSYSICVGAARESVATDAYVIRTARGTSWPPYQQRHFGKETTS